VLQEQAAITLFVCLQDGPLPIQGLQDRARQATIAQDDTPHASTKCLPGCYDLDAHPALYKLQALVQLPGTDTFDQAGRIAYIT
jgi:hypothetical protein